jgi:hypothetical protein
MRHLLLNVPHQAAPQLERKTERAAEKAKQHPGAQSEQRTALSLSFTVTSFS